jgi:hypothetical protein
MTEDKWLEPDDDITPFDTKYEKDRKKKRATASSPLGHDREDTIKQISKAKRTSEQKAGLVKNTESGSVFAEDDGAPDRIPSESIHEFENLEVCVCECHLKNKKDCMLCYDHPIHLKDKREHYDNKKDTKSVDGYDEAKIMELIEKDKAKTKKTPWWKF